MTTVFLGDLMYRNEGVGNKVIPLGIGYIASYLNEYFAGEVNIYLFKDADALLEMAKIETPDVVALSNYPWTTNLASQTLKALKNLYPSVITVMGGPNYPNEPDLQRLFLSKRPHLDFYTYLESEPSFLGLVSLLANSDFELQRCKTSPIPGVHYYDEVSAQMICGITNDRIQELDTIPSPYLTGLFDEFIEKGLEPAVQTNRGCPFTCSFCVEGERYHTPVRRFSFERVQAELEYIAKRVVPGQTLDITDSNFGMYDQDIDTCKVLRRLQDEYSWPLYINVSTGKNRTAHVVECSKLTRGAISVSLQVQSMDSEVLTNIKRKNISVTEMTRAVEETSKLPNSPRSFSAVITPLPGETLESHYNGLRKLMDMDMNYICPFQLMLLNGTSIASQLSRKQYGMKSKFRAIPNYFGEFGDGAVHAIEIEEICVENNTFTFDDYIDARTVHQLMGWFHADDAMLEIRKYLGCYSIPSFDWLLRMKNLFEFAPQRVRDLHDEFVQQAKDELWDSEEELLSHWNMVSNRDAFTHGESGDNLFFKFRARGLTDSFRDLAEFGSAAAIELVLEKEPQADAMALQGELSELVNYMSLKRKLPMSEEEITADQVRVFHYDFSAWESDGWTRHVREYACNPPLDIMVRYSEDQKEQLLFAYHAQGVSSQGMGMFLRKHNPLFFVRDTVRANYIGVDMPVRELE